MTQYHLPTLCEALVPLAQKAGQAIMAVRAKGVVAQEKGDGSPVTEADARAEAIVLEGLAKIAPDIPVVSEENAASHAMAPPEQFFLVDPLDGTKEFLKPGTGHAFTVNIALIENGVPVLGVIDAPAQGRLFFGATGTAGDGCGAFEVRQGRPSAIHVRNVPDEGPVATVSVSHRDAQTDDWLRARSICTFNGIGSSLKFCLIAAGEADIYPRFSPTMEWDTAAGDAILRAAGGQMTFEDGTPFTYGKPDYRNGPFIAGSPAVL